jgi:hypothetical protein
MMPTGTRENYAASFVKHHLVMPAQLEAAERVVCMSQIGVNLLLQRWVHHNSRVVVPTQELQRMSAPQFEEADLTEEWCIDREDDDIEIEPATREVDSWLSELGAAGTSRRSRLNNEQQRSQIRRELRVHLQALQAGRQ